MAGKLCPKCGEYTFFEAITGRKCSKCGYQMFLPPNDWKGGKGQKCTHCGKYTVFGNKCNNCGAKYSVQE